MNHSRKDEELFNSVRITPCRKKPQNKLAASSTSRKRSPQSKAQKNYFQQNPILQNNGMVPARSTKPRSQYNNSQPNARIVRETKPTRLVEITLDNESSINQIRKVVEEARKKSPQRLR